MTDPDAGFAVSRNPATGETIARYPLLDAADIETMLASAERGARAWRGMPLAERAALLARLAAVLRGDLESHARRITAEMGKPIVQARGEVEKCASLCDWYAAHGPTLLADERMTVDDGRAAVHWQPLGIVLGVMPWNFPLWQALRAAVPIMLAGNGFLLKHADNVQGSARALADAFVRAGYPEGAFAVANVSQQAISVLIADRRIAAVTVTAGIGAGAAVAAEAGRNLKKSVLELGGADPFVVLADADLDRAVDAAVRSRFLNTGQVCIAAKRLIVAAPILDAFTERFIAKTEALTMGDPMDEANFLGPLARPRLREELHRQVEASIAAGAELRIGGQAIEGKGAYYAPTVLTGVRPGMPAFDEELFGPVAAIIAARDADDAITLANESAYGLSAALWTSDAAQGQALAERIETGGVFVNGISASDPRVPIGGVKRSGYGRELAYFGLREFSNAKLIWARD